MTQSENIQTIQDAIELMYQTHITDAAVAEQRGIAIRAMDKMILLLGGDSAVQKVEAVPYSARLRARGKDIGHE